MSVSGSYINYLGYVALFLTGASLTAYVGYDPGPVVTFLLILFVFFAYPMIKFRDEFKQHPARILYPVALTTVFIAVWFLKYFGGNGASVY